MTVTYEAIATHTTSGSATTYTFSSIPSTYTDLVLVCNGALDSPGSIYFRFNGDTSSLYSYTYILGDGSSASSGRGSTTFIIAADFSASNSTSVSSIMNYANTTTNKTVLSRAGAANLNTIAFAGLWRSTAAINALTLLLAGGRSFANGTTFSLYGIKAE
jgi:hypothetical protein